MAIEKPFYEFDAWCCARVDRHGSLFDLVLSHRYSKLDVTVRDILGAYGHPNMCYAFCDFIQNYMDITRPLPDFPLLEEYRPLDPVTAEHDRQTGWPAWHWRDLDMDTFKKKVDRMHIDATMEDINAYAETAYRSRRKQPELGEANQQSTLFRKGWTMGPPLSKGRLSGVLPDGFVDICTTEDLRENEDIEKEKGVTEVEERHTYLGRLDEKMLRYATLPKTSWALIYMRHLGRVIFLMLLCISILVWTFGWTREHADVSALEYLFKMVVPTFCYFLLPFLILWSFGVFIEKYFPKIMYREPGGPLWELNRQTGQVILYHHPENSDRPGEVDVEAPFHEWDGYMLRLPDHQGFIWYKLVLVHKTREWALPLNQLIAATTHREEVFAYWDLIRHYMDVSKPLPDIPLFEPFRHLDPTSVAYDQKQNRQRHYWRDMDSQSYKAFRSQNSRKLHSYRWEPT